MKIAFQLKSRCFPRKFTESLSAAKGTQTLNQKCSSVETRHFMVHINIYIYDIYDLHINISKMLDVFLTFDKSQKSKKVK